MVGPLVTLLLLLWRYRPVRLVIATLYAVLIAFGWLMERNVEGWHTTTPTSYLFNGFLALGAFLVPAAVLMSLSDSPRSWLVGLLLTWPVVLLSVALVASGCVISTIGCVPFEAGPTLAGTVLPVLLVLVTWLSARLTRIVHESLAIFFAHDRSNAPTHAGRTAVPLLGGRPISDDYFAGPMVRQEDAPRPSRRSRRRI